MGKSPHLPDRSPNNVSAGQPLHQSSRPGDHVAIPQRHYGCPRRYSVGGQRLSHRGNAVRRRLQALRTALNVRNDDLGEIRAAIHFDASAVVASWISGLPTRSSIWMAICATHLQSSDERPGRDSSSNLRRTSSQPASRAGRLRLDRTAPAIDLDTSIKLHGAAMRPNPTPGRAPAGARNHTVRSAMSVDRLRGDRVEPTFPRSCLISTCPQCERNSLS